ncbi:MAG: 50S ribosomal protein L11 methyltransferase [Gemmatimonadota bacterium]
MSRPARGLVLTVRVPAAEVTDERAEGLVALGGSAVEEEMDLLTTYVAEPADADAFLRDAADRIEALAGAPVEMLWRWQDDEDWSARWKEGLGPRTAGRITVTQPWNPVEATGDRVVIVIDPANAFGTGQHATTRGALRLLQDAVPAGGRVLDVGSGSAILSIAAARLGADRVLAVESDGDALETAAENVERNRVGDRVTLVHALVDADYLARVAAPPFDLVVANVLSGVLVPLLPALARSVSREGAVILGGIMVAESASVRSAAAAAGLDTVRQDREGEWWTGLLRRRRD